MNRSQGIDQGGLVAVHQEEIYQRKGKGNRKVVEELAGHLGDRDGHLRDHEDTANHRGGEADHQGVAVAPQEGEVNLQDGVVGQGHHAVDVTVINSRGATPKDKHTKGTQTQSKFKLYSYKM